VAEKSSVAVSGTAPAAVAVLKWELPVSVLRMLAVGLALVALTLAIVGRGANRRTHTAFGRRLVQASNVDFGDRSLVDMDQATALAKLANLYDTVVLHVVRPQSDLFLVVVDQTVYRYAELIADGDEAVGEDRAPALDTT